MKAQLQDGTILEGSPEELRAFYALNTTDATPQPKAAPATPAASPAETTEQRAPVQQTFAIPRTKTQPALDGRFADLPVLRQYLSGCLRAWACLAADTRSEIWLETIIREKRIGNSRNDILNKVQTLGLARLVKRTNNHGRVTIRPNRVTEDEAVAALRSVRVPESAKRGESRVLYSGIVFDAPAVTP